MAVFRWSTIYQKLWAVYEQEKPVILSICPIECVKDVDNCRSTIVKSEITVENLFPYELEKQLADEMLLLVIHVSSKWFKYYCYFVELIRQALFTVSIIQFVIQKSFYCWKIINVWSNANPKWAVIKIFAQVTGQTIILVGLLFKLWLFSENWAGLGGLVWESEVHYCRTWPPIFDEPFYIW